MNVLFTSDLHPEAERPDITRAFLFFLDERARRTEVLCVLGDFFGAWIGNDGMDTFQRSIAQSLHQVVDGGTRIHLTYGNRDSPIDKAFYREVGCTLLPDLSVINLYGEPVLLIHRDNLCIRDKAYIHLRRWLRNPFTLWVLRHLPLVTRHKLARKLHKESRAQARMEAADTIDVTPEEVPQVIRRHDVRTPIHGHTYWPAEHPLNINGQPAQRIMPDDQDHQGWVLEIDTNGHRQASLLL